MKEQSRSFWFPAKSYGFGWGMPVAWQGWLVFIGYFVLQYLGFQHFKAQRNVPMMMLYLLVLTMVLVAVIVVKGERPAKWRWRGE